MQRCAAQSGNALAHANCIEQFKTGSAPASAADFAPAKWLRIDEQYAVAMAGEEAGRDCSRGSGAYYHGVPLLGYIQPTDRHGFHHWSKNRSGQCLVTVALASPARAAMSIASERVNAPATDNGAS